MSYRITIEEVFAATERVVEDRKIYEQTVDVLDIPAVMAAVNRKPRKPRVRKEKEEK